jgi:uncharacterized protein (DUF1697 family)
VTCYVAFLRGINVGGRGVLKMQDLARMFASAGCERVKTYIQSGNAVFESRAGDLDGFQGKIEKRLRDRLGVDVKVMLRTAREIENLVNLDPFEKAGRDPKVKKYVAFLYGKPRSRPELPLISAKEGIEVFLVKNLEAFGLSREVKGRYGFPNNFIEKELGVPATTRNWNTVCKVAALASP